MPASLLNIHDFSSLFRGYVSAYGVHIPADEKEDNGKAKGKSFTETKILTEELYTDHINGKTSIGVVPINEEGTCYFGAIDVDAYSDNSLLIRTIHKHAIPVVPFRSKSGGLHLYVFFKEPAKAKDAVLALRKLRAALGLPVKTEIFPKQVSHGENRIGNWINLPYFNSDSTERYAYGKDGTPLGLSEAIDFCHISSVTCKEIDEAIDSLPLNDAPPCLQAIYLTGETNARNLYLFSLARYYKAKFGDDFEQYLMEANMALNKPLGASELTNIIQSHKRKDYTYKCTDAPLNDLCQKSECAKRTFGQGSSSVSDLSFEELIQWRTDPPYYEWKVNGHILRFFDENDIIQQHAFRKMCFRELHIMPARLKDELWTRVVNTALKNVEEKVVALEDDVSPGALFHEYLTEFLTKRAMADTKEQVLVDKVFFDQEKKAFYFKAKNLLTFLIYQKQFRYYGQTEIQSRLKQMGALPIRLFVNAKNTNVRLWSFPKESINTFVEIAQDEVAIDFMEEYKDEQF